MLIYRSSHALRMTGAVLCAALIDWSAACSSDKATGNCPVASLTFTSQPAATSGGAVLPAVRVEAQNASASTATCFQQPVTLSIASNPAGVTLSGTTTVNAISGVATFSDLSVDKAGSSYALEASASGVPPDTSASFSVAIGPAAKLVFVVEPVSTTPATAIAPAIRVAATDAGSNTDTTYTGTISIALGTNPGAGALSGTTSQSAVAGVATFTGLSIDSAGNGYTLVASSGTLTTATSSGFDVGTVQPPGGGGALPIFGHEVIVLEENHSANQVTSSSMPWLTAQIPSGALATQYYANTHPSIGNYFWLTTGQLITNNDSYSTTVSADNIVRQLVAAGKTWKAYGEDLPSVGYTGQKSGGFARKHYPLSFFSDVVNDSTQIKNLVPFTQFATDLANGTLPQYSFVTPNLCDDAHDCSLQTADTWLQTNIAPLLTNPAFQTDGLLIITFDESSGDNTHGGGQVFWLALGPKVRKGFSSTTLYQHENTLRLMAEGLGLTSFPGAAATASNMSEMFVSSAGIASR